MERLGIAGSTNQTKKAERKATWKKSEVNYVDK